MGCTNSNAVNFTLDPFCCELKCTKLDEYVSFSEKKIVVGWKLTQKHLIVLKSILLEYNLQVILSILKQMLNGDFKHAYNKYLRYVRNKLFHKTVI